jgi:diguanylate cyclase (GGDEF)-like protein/putative nucleotidyltransferase with HDIG domain
VRPLAVAARFGVSWADERGTGSGMRPELHAQISEALAQLLPLPVLSGTAARVRTLAADDGAGTDRLVEVIDGDEAFALNLLRFANASAVRTLRARSVRHAVTLVGRRAVGRLALEAATYRFLEQVPGAGRISRGQMHTHAVEVAAAAAAAAERTRTDAESAHLAGLLHDVGKLVLPLAFGAERVQAIVERAPVGIGRAELEREELGVDHAYAGALLAREAAAGADVARAIEFHHGGRSGQDSPDPVCACVQIANAVVALAAGHEPDHELIHAALDVLDLPLSALDELAEHSASPATGAPASDLATRVVELERLAQTDELTGLANRRHWLTEVQAALNRGEPGALLICDVDHFKQINDELGHRAGDLVLSEIARVLRRYGLAGRLGGDELALWVPGTLDQGREVAQRLLGDVEHELEATVQRPATLSVGLAAAPQHGRETVALLETADRALYSAKAAGRNRAIAALPV